MPFSQIRSGSSPLARGLPQTVVSACADIGIIPARAGFTAARCRWGWGPGDHPRSRGVYTRRHGTSSPTLGSSPLARGLPRAGRWWRSGGRIIPARAGFTWGRRSAGGGGADHPRSRGVYTDCTTPAHWDAGSSPLARGLREDRQAAADGRWIIPARAGFTGPEGAGDAAGQDHPRSRGVYLANDYPQHGWWGSSPLARGLPTLSPESARQAGIIPARAGFTRHDCPCGHS